MEHRHWISPGWWLSSNRGESVAIRRLRPALGRRRQGAVVIQRGHERVDHLRRRAIDATQRTLRRRAGTRRCDVLGAVERRWDAVGGATRGDGSEEGSLVAPVKVTEGGSSLGSSL